MADGAKAPSVISFRTYRSAHENVRSLHLSTSHRIVTPTTISSTYPSLVATTDSKGREHQSEALTLLFNCCTSFTDWSLIARTRGQATFLQTRLTEAPLYNFRG